MVKVTRSNSKELGRREREDEKGGRSFLSKRPLNQEGRGRKLRGCLNILHREVQRGKDRDQSLWRKKKNQKSTGGGCSHTKDRLRKMSWGGGRVVKEINPVCKSLGG